MRITVRTYNCGRSPYNAGRRGAEFAATEAFADKNGAEGGIRTPEARTPPVFKTGAVGRA